MCQFLCIFICIGFPQVNITVHTNGLSNNITDSVQSCYLEDVERRFTITLPAVEVIPGISYTCVFGDAQVPSYDGIKASNYVPMQCYVYT